MPGPTAVKSRAGSKGIFAISSVAFPGAAEAIKQAGKGGKVLVTGLSTPNDMKSYVKDGTVKSVILWNTQDLGYLTVYAAEALATGKLKAGATTFHAGASPSDTKTYTELSNAGLDAFSSAIGVTCASSMMIAIPWKIFAAAS